MGTGRRSLRTQFIADSSGLTVMEQVLGFNSWAGYYKKGPPIRYLGFLSSPSSF